LPAPADHHLRRVLRLRPGSLLTVTDGRGGRASAVLTADGVDVGGWEHEARPPAIVLHPGLAKAGKLDLVVEKATELGVGVIAPVVCERSEVRWDAGKAAARVARWRTIAVSALEQSRGVWLPQVEPPALFADVITSGTGFVFDQRGCTGSASLETDPPERAVVGPEGGLTDGELQAAQDAGWTIVSLGPRVLRTETAAIVAATLIARAHRLL
jgi:16S rRNA (uracil1498-N3)-methyltransferase